MFWTLKIPQKGRIDNQFASEYLSISDAIETDLGTISCLKWEQVTDQLFLVLVGAKDGRIKMYLVMIKYCFAIHTTFTIKLYTYFTTLTLTCSPKPDMPYMLALKLITSLSLINKALKKPANPFNKALHVRKSIR